MVPKFSKIIWNQNERMVAKKVLKFFTDFNTTKMKFKAIILF